jgi:hypothetical protein
VTLAAEAPRGGLVEYIGGRSHVLLLRLREIERIEDKHRGIFELWEAFWGRGKKPTSREIRDLLALGLVGGGLKDHEADAVIGSATPGDLLRFYQIAHAVLGVALLPDAEAEADAQKKSPVQTGPDASDSTSGSSSSLG